MKDSVNRVPREETIDDIMEICKPHEKTERVRYGRYRDGIIIVKGTSIEAKRFAAEIERLAD